MYTVTDILQDAQRGCALYNMVEDKFSYRLVYFINERNGKSAKHYHDSTYNGLRKALENIIRGNLTTTNTIVLADVTTRKSGKTVSLLSRSYGYCLDEYFDRVTERHKDGNKKRSTIYGNTYRKKVASWQWNILQGREVRK